MMTEDTEAATAPDNNGACDGVKLIKANGAAGDQLSTEAFRPPPGLSLPPETASPQLLPAKGDIPNDSSYNHLSADPPLFVPSGAAQWLDGLKEEANTLEQNNNHDIISTLPSFHRSLLRGSFVDTFTGAWMPYYVGRLKSFSHKNGYGFLECPSAFEHWGFDVFIHKKLLPQPWSLGQLVEFAVVVNDRGQPQAADVRWLPPLPGTQPNRAAVVHKAADVVDEDRVEPPEEKNAEAVPGEARYLGTVKSFSPAQGYGFLTCAELRTRFRRDIYFECSQMPRGGWAREQTVEFTVALNARGQPQARKIDWDPVPMLDGSPTAPRDHGTVTLEQLSQLLKKLHEGQVTDVLGSAIELQGQDGASIDFVTFVLDRLPRPELTIQHVTDSMQVPLLLLLSQILRQPRRQRLVSWFDVLSRSVDPLAALVSGHFDQMVLEIASHSGPKAMACLVAQDPGGFDVYCASVKRLQAKCRSRATAGSNTQGAS